MRSVGFKWAVLVLSFASCGAAAQELPSDPPRRAFVDERQIDLISGRPMRTYPMVRIGDPASGGLEQNASLGFTEIASAFSGWIDTSDGHSFYVILNDRTYAFTNGAWYLSGAMGPGIINGFDFVSQDGDNSTLKREGDVWTFVSQKGEVAVFKDSLDRHLPYTGLIDSAQNQPIAYGGQVADLVSYRKANGEQFDVTYEVVEPYVRKPDGSVQFGYSRKKSVASNSGYQIHALYTPGQFSYVAFNAALDTCAPLASACPGLTKSRTGTNGGGGGTTTIIDSLGRKWSYTSASTDHFISSITSPIGRTQTNTDYLYVYQVGGGLGPGGVYVPPQTVARARITSWSNGSQTWRYAYADSGQATGTTLTVTDPLGKTRTVQVSFPPTIYQAPGTLPGKPLLSSDTDENGRTTRYEYGDYQRLTKIVFPEGNSVSYAYDQWGNRTLVTWTAKPGSGLPAIVTIANHDANCPSQITCSSPAYTIDARGNRTDYSYDPVHGQVLTVTGPAPTAGAPRPQTRYSYTALYAWYKDASGTLVQAPTPVYKLTGTSTCATGSNCVGTSDETRRVITYGTPGTPNNLLPTVETVMSGDGAIISTRTTTYNAFGDVIAVDGPLPGNADTVRSYYDVMGQKVGVLQPDPDGAGPLKNPAVRTTYDLDGLSTLVEHGTMNDAASDLSSFAAFDQVASNYDSVGRKISDVKSAGGTAYAATQYSYDSVDRLACTAVRMNLAAYGSLPADACTLGTQGSQGPDRVTKNVYDAAGQVLQVRKAVGTPLEQAYATSAYSANGKPTDLMDANGNRAQMVYDGFDRQTRWSFPGPARPSGYNPSTPANAFATAGAVSTTDYEEYGYDAGGNRTSLRKRDGRTFTYNYDALNRVTAKIVPDGCPSIGTGICLGADRTRDVYYGYDLRGLQTYARFDSASGSDAVVSSYDALGDLTASTTAMYGTSRTLQYRYDAAGNRTAIVHPDGVTIGYVYDGLNRNTQTLVGSGQANLKAYDAAGRLTSNFGGAVTYAYDPVDRLQTLAMQDLTGGPNANTTTLGYNPASQITSRARSNDGYAFTGYVTANRGYAVNGLNQYTQAGAATFGYDANGNLTGDGTNSYGYDAENRLILTGGQVYLYYDPLGRLWQTSTGQAGVTQFLYDGDKLAMEYDGSRTLLRRYITGVGEDTPELWYEGGGFNDPRFLFADHQGSITALFEPALSRTAVNTYDEYGIPGATNTGRFQYTGQAWIPELGMYYYKARMYSPTLGRFLQTDPIGYKDQNNLYAYVANDPVNGRDPTGLACKTVGSATVCAETPTGSLIPRTVSVTFKTGNMAASAAATSTGVSASARAGDVSVSASADRKGSAVEARAGDVGVGARADRNGASVTGRVGNSSVTAEADKSGASVTGRSGNQSATLQARTIQPDKVPVEYRAAQMAQRSEQRTGFWDKVGDVLDALKDAFH